MVHLFKSTSRITSRHRVSLQSMMPNIKISTSNKNCPYKPFSDMNESYNESSSVLIGEKSIDHPNQETLKSGSQ